MTQPCHAALAHTFFHVPFRRQVLVLRDMSAVCPEAQGMRVWVKLVLPNSPAGRSIIKVLTASSPAVATMQDTLPLSRYSVC